MHPSQSDTGATEFLANLSITTVVLVALGLTLARLLLLQLDRSATPRASSNHNGSWMRGLAEIFESFVVAFVLVFLIIRPFFVQAFFIPSESMENTLQGHDEYNPKTQEHRPDTIHDHIFVNKMVYRYSDPQRGDIVVFKAPKEADGEALREGRPQVENTLIKRCIAVPGDTIEVKPDAVYLNGKRLDEFHEPLAGFRYSINEPMQDAYETHWATEHADTHPGPLHLGPNQYWMMGDNRNHSNDSRYWGPLDRSRVIGKATFIFWPPTRIRILK